jgi:hypothetical protein
MRQAAGQSQRCMARAGRDVEDLLFTTKAKEGGKVLGALGKEP